MQLQVTVQDGIIWVRDGNRSVDLTDWQQLQSGALGSGARPSRSNQLAPDGFHCYKVTEH